MLLSFILLIFSTSQAASLPLEWPVLKGPQEKQRIEEALLFIKKKTALIPDGLSKSDELENAHLLYFLESHLDTLKSIGLDCKKKDQALKDSILRSLPREAKEEELLSSHRSALNDLFKSLCRT